LNSTYSPSVPAPRHAGLDLLRLSAAALVLFAHGGTLLFPALPVYDLYLLAGWLGTELFFALSGFLVVGMLLSTPPTRLADASAFAATRLWRVLPAFWLFVVVNLALWWIVRGEWPERLWTYPLLLQNSWAVHPAFFGEAWNLPVLALFWLLAPLLAIWATTRPDRRRALRNALVALALVGLAIRSGAVVAFEPAWDAGVRKLLPLRLDACAWGGVLACWWARRPPPAHVSQVALIGLTTGVFWLLPLDSSAFARTGLFTLVGLACAMPLPWLCRGASGKALGSAARAGFLLYLVNMPLLQLGLLGGLGTLGSVPAFMAWLIACLLMVGGLIRMLPPTSVRR